MTEERLVELFEIHKDEFLRDERIQNRLHQRSDIAAMLLLHELYPGKCDIISWAGHDEIALKPLVTEVIERITEDHIIELIRYGVLLMDGSYFGMLV